MFILLVEQSGNRFETGCEGGSSTVALPSGIRRNGRVSTVSAEQT